MFKTGYTENTFSNNNWQCSSLSNRQSVLNIYILQSITLCSSVCKFVLRQSLLIELSVGALLENGINSLAKCIIVWFHHKQ